MKKSVINYKTTGTRGSLELEILVDVNRELTEADKYNLREHAEQIMKSLKAETIRLDPQTKIDAIEQKVKLLQAFGDQAIYVEEIPNGYCSDYCCKHLPWFVVTTSKGRITIGWRKRVIVIDWQDSVIEDSAETLFPNEDTTKYDKLIHAWGYDKAREYVETLLK